MNGRMVGTWQFGRESRFTYAETWSVDPTSRPISLSLPLSTPGSSHSGPMVESFFDNLLPDSDIIRRRLQSQFGISGNSSFDLLAEIGRDCVGALQLVPEGEVPTDVKSISGEDLTEGEIASTLRRQAGTGSVLGQPEQGFRISLAGAQEKTAFLFHKGRWCRPTGATPTTHIFKRPLGVVGHQGIDLSTSLENEWLCLKIVEGFGIPVPKAHIESFEDETALIVERFDRRLSDDGIWWIRLPQEDFCQALGLPSGLKYQNDGGPGIRDIAAILNDSENAEADKRIFFKVQILFWLLTAIDGHAKNFSIYHLPGGRFRLTPLYDIISAYPVTGHGAGLLHPKELRMAMAVKGSSGNIYHWDKILRRHWITTAREAGLSPAIASDIIDEIHDAVPFVVEEVARNIPNGFPAVVVDRILGGISAGSGRLAE